MSLGALCDICGEVVRPDEAVVAEVSVGPSMCPTSMTLHPACHQRASVMWQPDDTCTGIDPDYPEMAEWLATPESSGSG